MVAAIAAAERGLLGRARALTAAALGELDFAGSSESSENTGERPPSAAETNARTRLRLVAACVLFVTRDHGRALALAEAAAAATSGLRREAIELAVTLAEVVGWDQDARRILEAAEAAEAAEADARWPARRTRLLVRAGAPAAALEAAARARELAPNSPRMSLETARLLAGLGRPEEAVAEVVRALALAPPGVARYHRGAAAILADAGDFAAAEAARRTALALNPGELGDRLALAEYALWRGAEAEAASWLAEAQGLAAETADTAETAETAGILRIEGALAALAGDLPRARRALDRAVSGRSAGDPGGALAHTWRAEVALREGALADAEAAAAAAIAGAGAYHPIAWILRFLAVVAAEPGSRETAVAAVSVAEFREVAAEILPEAGPLFAGGRRSEVAAALEEVLRRCRGNRSPTLSYVDQAGIQRRVRSRVGVRYAARQALRQIRGLPPAAVIAALDRVVADYPGSALPICHRGELRLWLGDLGGARADLEAAIERHPQTRWAYIGLAGVAIAEGAPARALEISARGVRVMGGTEGPAVFVYRGEARRLLGDLAGARRDLERALEISRERLGAALGLALVSADAGDPAGFAAIWRELECRGRGLLSDAAAELGIVVWGDRGAVAPLAARRRVLALALEMCRGNRSTGLTTYFTGAGALRFVAPEVDAAAWRAADRYLLGRAVSLLRAAETGRF